MNAYSYMYNCNCFPLHDITLDEISIAGVRYWLCDMIYY